MTIFYSHSKPFARMIASALKEFIASMCLSHTPIFSPNFIPGTKFREEIQKGIAESNGMVLIVTADSIGAPWTMFEAGAFYHSKPSNPLLVIFFGCQREDLPTGDLQSIQYIIGNNKTNGDQFKAALEKLFQLSNVEFSHSMFNSSWKTFSETTDKLLSEIPTNVKPTNETIEIIQGSRTAISAMQWKDLYEGAKSRIWLLGHTMRPCVSPGSDFSGDSIKKAISNNPGLDFRLVFLDPDLPTDVLIYEIDRQVNGSMRSKLQIVRTAAAIWRDGISPDSKNISIGTTSATIHNSIVIVDDELIVTNYSHENEFGNAGSTMRLNGNSPKRESLFKSCVAEFKWHWRRSRPVFNHIHSFPKPLEFRVLDQREYIHNSAQWHNATAGQGPALMPPRVAVIFPTFRCAYKQPILDKPEPILAGVKSNELLCDECMFKPVLIDGRFSMGKGMEMPVSSFKTIVEGLADCGVPAIEISGGGEPLSHRDAGSLLDIMKAARNRHSNRPKVGLISHIRHLSDGLETKRLFCEIAESVDYVRWSWTDKVLPDTDDARAYLAGLKAFVECAREKNPSLRIGVKFLATKSNCTDHGTPLVKLVEQVFNIGVNHAKVRTLRSTKESSETDGAGCAASLEDLRWAAESLEQLWHSNKSQWRNSETSSTGKTTLEVDLAKRFVPQTFQCRLSSLFAVINPDTSLRMCWNDVDEKERSIGSLVDESTGEFKWHSIWGSHNHWAKVSGSGSTASRCNNRHGCHCRVVGYHHAASHLFALGDSSGLGADKQYHGDGFL